MGGVDFTQDGGTGLTQESSERGLAGGEMGRLIRFGRVDRSGKRFQSVSFVLGSKAHWFCRLCQHVGLGHGPSDPKPKTGRDDLADEMGILLAHPAIPVICQAVKTI